MQKMDGKMTLKQKVKTYIRLFWYNNFMRFYQNWQWRKQWDSHPEWEEEWKRDHPENIFHPRNSFGGRISMKSAEYANKRILELEKEVRKEE